MTRLIQTAIALTSILAVAGIFDYIGFQSGYHEGIQIVWTYKTLGKCNVETGAEPQ